MCVKSEQNGIYPRRPSVLCAFNLPTDRREVIAKTVASIVAGVSSLSVPAPAEANVAMAAVSQKYPFVAYGIKADSSPALNPTLKSVPSDRFVKDIVATIGSKGGAVWLGEHHNSANDHSFQADFIEKSFEQRRKTFSGNAPPMAIGLEQVQVKYQPVLDDFIMGKISEETMRKEVEWEKRWSWPFEAYRPVFSKAKELGIQLVALNVNYEDLVEVEKAGLPGLAPDRLKAYIKDPRGFAEFAGPLSFKTYVDYVISPSYDMHQAMGILNYSVSGEKLENEMSFRNFFSGRVLWDEAMASAAETWTSANPGGLLVGLVGADHVKFSKGIPGRYARMVKAERDNITVMLNPTLIDTRRAGSVSNVMNSDSSQIPNSITLQLRYVKDGIDPSQIRAPESTGGVLPLADYIVVSNYVQNIA